MSCEKSKACSAGECPGCCKNSRESVYEIGLNAIVELEIHYSEAEDMERGAYVFEGLYCLTNMQNREPRLTGFEGNRYDDLDKMRLQIIDYLMNNGDASCDSYHRADVSYIKDDI